VEAHQPARICRHAPVGGVSRTPQRGATDTPRPRIMTSPRPGPLSGHAQAPTPGAMLMLGALGVVYGDIGTSPLYTLRACLTSFGDFAPAHVLGVLSILFWLLMLVVSVKYVALDRKSTRLNSSHVKISYAVFCLKKKK